MNSFRHRVGSFGCGGGMLSPPGWTLIELMGVLAILTILSAAFVPILTREADRIARIAESREMAAIASAVEQGVRRHRAVPDSAGWAEWAANELGRRVDDVLTNSRGGRRLWIVDPRLRLGPGEGATLPYQQTSAGSREPVHPRIILISSLGDPLPGVVRDGIASSNERFDAIWMAAPGAVPANWSWRGLGEDLTVQRLDLSDQFVPVVLNPSPVPPHGQFGWDATGTNAVPVGAQASWHLRQSLLRLHADDGTLQVSLVLRSPVSAGFERGAWRGRPDWITADRHFNGAGVDEAVGRLFAAPANPQATNGPAVLLESVSNYFGAYLGWTAAGFPQTGSDAAAVDDAAARVGLASLDLIRTP